jgi:hypothetical protein
MLFIEEFSTTGTLRFLVTDRTFHETVISYILVVLLVLVDQ